MKRLLFPAVLLSLAGAASAQAIDTYPEYTGDVTGGWNAIAQTFQAPGSTLTSFKFGIAGDANGDAMTVSVYNWSGGAQTGSALYSTTFTRPTSATDVVLSGLNIGLTVGNEYGVTFDLLGQSNPSVNYLTKTTGDPNPGGNGYWTDDTTLATWQSFPTLDTEFRAEFNSVPEPASFLPLGMVGVLAVLIRRRGA